MKRRYIVIKTYSVMIDGPDDATDESMEQAAVDAAFNVEVGTNWGDTGVAADEEPSGFYFEASDPEVESRALETLAQERAQEAVELAEER